jgi:phosphoribosylanthranilate isomerase
MASDIRVKICGLSTPETVAASAAAGAAYVGFVFFQKSPRNVTIEQARALAIDVPVGVAKVALTVDPDDTQLQSICEAVPLDMIQLHGNETPERVADVRALTGLPVMKAVGIAGADDVEKLDAYAAVSDQLLVDAKPAPDGELPGGNGITFDWRLISNRRWSQPWMLAGGLTPQNVAEAIRLTGARQIDVSSGVESAPGIKDEAAIRAFVTAAQG